MKYRPAEYLTKGISYGFSKCYNGLKNLVQPYNCRSQCIDESFTDGLCENLQILLQDSSLVRPCQRSSVEISLDGSRIRQNVLVSQQCLLSLSHGLNISVKTLFHRPLRQCGLREVKPKFSQRSGLAGVNRIHCFSNCILFHVIEGCHVSGQSGQVERHITHLIANFCVSTVTVNLCHVLGNILRSFCHLSGRDAHGITHGLEA